MSIDMPVETCGSEDKYKKMREERLKRIDELKKKLPNNKIVSQMSGSEEEKKEESGDWEIISQAVWAARDAYMEDGLSLTEAVEQLKEALDACVVVCGGDSPEEMKRLREIARS